MEANERLDPEPNGGLCALEWLASALDAARALADVEDSRRFRLDYSQLYTEELRGL